MADDAVVDGGGEDTPIVSDEVTKGAPPEPTDPDEPTFVSAEELQKRADDFEATLGIDKSPEEGEGEPEKGEPAQVEAAPSQIEELLRQNRELLETIKSLTTAAPGTTGVESEDPLAAARAASPEIKQLDEVITSTEKDTAAITLQNNTLFNQLALAQSEVLELQGALKFADPEDKPELRNQLNEKVAVRDRISQQMDRNDERANRNAAQLSSLKLQKSTVERELNRSVEEAKKQSEFTEVSKVETRNEFNITFSQEAKDAGVDPKSPMYARLFRDIKNELVLYTSHLAAKNPTAPGIDIAAATKYLFKQMADTYNIGRRQELGAASRAKVANRSAVARPGTRLPQPAAAAGPRRLTLEEVRARRDAILGGGRA